MRLHAYTGVTQNTHLLLINVGDSLPQNNEERIYVVVAMIVGGAYYGYVIATMSSLVRSIDQNASLCNSKLDGVSSYMIRKKFPKLLKRRIRTYYKMYFEIQTAVDEKAILSELPPHLQSAVANHLVDDEILSLVIDKLINITCYCDTKSNT